MKMNPNYTIADLERYKKVVNSHKRALKCLYKAAGNCDNYDTSRKIWKKINWLEANRKEIMYAFPEKLRRAHRNDLRVKIQCTINNMRHMHDKAFTIDTTPIFA